jgi:putative heme-binding domain-containing protein
MALRRFSILCISWLSLWSSTALAAEPLVHMLVPGFTVRELPVHLPNVNNLRFAPDGRLTALGYDGRVWLLRDSNGDGLEDSAEVFWDQASLSVPVGMAWSTDGLFVSSHGKVSLLRDTDGDGKADREEIIASGWTPTDVGSGGVDATAVTLDGEGNVYFGLLVADYSNAYRLRKRKDLKPEERAWLEAHGKRAGGDPEEEVSLYDIHSQRGTIQKWSPRTKRLETIATGIRVPYALRFNKAGDLFNTDQEGETWMPNGNPLDELNHIVPGRNYGFPPRHDKWLPNLVSEPPVVAFGPQHESTCGLVFNEPHRRLNVEGLKGSSVKRGGQRHGADKGVNASTVEQIDPSTIPQFNPPLPCSPGQGLFGPKWWEGDAVVAGESRGKIWRVRLVKTPHGYVGKEFLIARLSMLALDLAISPKGDLYVCCHSGLPDWGTGPKGEGKIFKISYTDTKAPQPVIAWACGPWEARIAFDKALDPTVTNAVFSGRGLGLTNAAAPFIEFGEYVRAADHYEVLKPPYQVVKLQEAAPRGRIKITAARLEGDRHTLVLTTEAHPQMATYALTIPGVKAEGSTNEGATVDVDYDLRGVDVFSIHDPMAARLPRKLREIVRSSGIDWLNRAQSPPAAFPQPDLSVVRALAGSFENQLRTYSLAKENAADRVQLLFRFDPPHDADKVRLTAKKEFELLNAGLMQPPCVKTNGNFVIEFAPGQLAPRETHVVMDHGAFPVSFTYTVNGDAAPRPLGFASFLHFWAPTNRVVETRPGDQLALSGGDYEGGRSLFFGDRLKCSTCHRLRGEGAIIGPDLSTLASRDAASVLRDIKEPSASINPDYVAYNVASSDGRELTGFIRAQDNDAIRLLGADGKETSFRPTEVKEMRVSGVSLMPTGLLDGLKEEQVRDLLTFLLSEPPKRSHSDLEQLLKTQPASGNTSENRQSGIVNRELKVVLVASKQDHGPGQHDYPAWQQTWLSLLTHAEANVSAATAWEWPTPDQFAEAGAIVFYFWNHDWNAERYRQLDEFLARGGGVVVFHSATIADKDPEQLAERIGLASQPQRTKYRHTPLDLIIVAPPDHPITSGLPRLIHFLDEPYWPMIGAIGKVDVLAKTTVDGEDQPMMWTFQNGKGRVFASILGHYTWTHEDPLFRLLALRGLAWAAGEPVGRFDELAAGARAPGHSKVEALKR